MKLQNQLLVAFIVNLPFALQTYSKRLHILDTVVQGKHMSFEELYDKTAQSYKDRYSDDKLELWRIEHWRAIFPTPAVYAIDVWVQALSALVIAYFLKLVRAQGLL